MTNTRPGLIIGYHGTDQEVAYRVLKGEDTIKPSSNKYDWLGNGIYFWEYSHSRALEFAEFLRTNQVGRTKAPSNPIKEPLVLGAVLDLKNCLDLTDYKNFKLLKDSYELLKAASEALEVDVPVNKSIGGSEDLILRDLDCAVINLTRSRLQDEQGVIYDSVRSVFWEGDEVYPTAGFREKNHIQLCIINPECIIGYFLPKEEVTRLKKL